MLSVLEIISKYNYKGHLSFEITEIIKLPSNLFSDIIKNEIKNYKLINNKKNSCSKILIKYKTIQFSE